MVTWGSLQFKLSRRSERPQQHSLTNLARHLGTGRGFPPCSLPRNSRFLREGVAGPHGFVTMLGVEYGTWSRPPPDVWRGFGVAVMYRVARASKRAGAGRSVGIEATRWKAEGGGVASDSSTARSRGGTNVGQDLKPIGWSACSTIRRILRENICELYCDYILELRARRVPVSLQVWGGPRAFASPGKPPVGRWRPQHKNV